MRLGIVVTSARAIVGSGALAPLHRKGHGISSEYYFRSGDVDEFLDKLAGGAELVDQASSGLISIAGIRRSYGMTIAHCVRLVVSGTLAVRERSRELVGLQGLFVDEREAKAAAVSDGGEVVSLDAACRVLRVSRSSLSLAIESGLIPETEPDAKAVLRKHVAMFAQKYIMISEIRETTGGNFSTLKAKIERSGFKPDPDLQACGRCGYLRAEFEPFLDKLKRGEASLSAPPAPKYALISEARKILSEAEYPIETNVMCSMLRERCVQFSSRVYVHCTMIDQKDEFVLLLGAGWWLRERAFMGRSFPSNDAKASYHDIICDEIVAIVKTAAEPLTASEILDRLAVRRIRVPSPASIQYVQRAMQARSEIVSFRKNGYWDASKPWFALGYDPRAREEKPKATRLRIG